jgi:hypothetical protein
VSIDSKLIQGAIWYHDKFSRPLMIRKVRVTTTANTSEIGSTSYSPPVATMFRGVFIAAVDGYEDKVFGGMRSGEGTLSVLPSQPIDEQDEIEVTVGTVTTNWRIDMRHPMHTPNAGTLYYIHCHLVRI